jgi:hypothetical protein
MAVAFDLVRCGSCGSSFINPLSDAAATMRRLQDLLADVGLFFVEGPLEDNHCMGLHASRSVGALKKLLSRNLRRDAAIPSGPHPCARTVYESGFSVSGGSEPLARPAIAPAPGAKLY